jgi:hypothetical protein
VQRVVAAGDREFVPGAGGDAGGTIYLGQRIGHFGGALGQGHALAALVAENDQGAKEGLGIADDALDAFIVGAGQVEPPAGAQGAQGGQQQQACQIAALGQRQQGHVHRLVQVLGQAGIDLCRERQPVGAPGLAGAAGGRPVGVTLEHGGRRRLPRCPGAQGARAAGAGQHALAGRDARVAGQQLGRCHAGQSIGAIRGGRQEHDLVAQNEFTLRRGRWRR